MIHTLNGVIPIDMLLNNFDKYSKLIKISLLSRKGRTRNWVLSNNQPRRIHKKRKILIEVPPLNADIEIIVAIQHVDGIISDKFCYISDHYGIQNNIFRKSIEKNTKETIEYYLNTKVDLTKPSKEVSFNVIIGAIINGQFFNLHSWKVSPERSHKWESTKGIQQNEEYNSDILIPMHFIEK